ncbi:MAG: sigma 54-interacting transcriptional regulator [Candidatus Hydrogenedentes bacterium]|nr:sigma 54-interacting transcriptional regulator [Candidatus Hydrogenedentota bacterium]
MLGTREDAAQELEAIMDTMADGVFVLDTLRVVRRWNRAMERLTGYSRDETVGNPCGVFTWLQRDVDEEAAKEAMFCQLFAAGNLDRSELTILCKDGSTLPALISARVLRDPDENPAGAVVTVTDISTLKRLETEVSLLRSEVQQRYEFHNIVGKSPAMRELFNLVELAAASQTTALIYGETGTGKELVAKAIHYHSERRAGPLVSVNCAALSETLVESELFGHVRGSFTGALKDHIGRFELAEGGTIFLDEVGEIPLALQVKLLRVIQEREIERIGDAKPRKVDVRIIAATHRDLRERVNQGSFREDLFYRLQVFPIYLPPLRQRKEDIGLLVEAFIVKFNERTGKTISGVDPDAMRMILDYPWPGNVRELENAVEHAFVTCRGGAIGPLDLPIEIRRAELKMPPPVPPPVFDFVPTPSTPKRRPVGKDELVTLLNESGWNKAEAARRLGITRTHLWRRMTQLGIPLNPTT